jgi:SAM-dependent methyltransferase
VSTPQAWPTLLERTTACPACGHPGLDWSRGPTCPSCGFEGRRLDGIPSLLDEARLTDGHAAEIQAQTAAVDSYYENESKLTCHWDRISAADLPGLLGFPAGLALDLGCGTGTAGSGLRNSGMQVVGADLSLPCLKAAARRLDAVVRVDAAHLPFRDETFDAVVSRGCLHHLHDAASALAETARVMKPGARAVFMDPREYAWLEPIKHALRREDDAFSDDHHAYTPEEYRALIEGAFEVERAFTWHPLGILAAHGLDLVPLPQLLPRRAVAKALLSVDRALNQTPLRAVGHLLVVVARRR